MADERTNTALQGIANGLESLKATLGGVASGLQSLGQGVHSGGSAAMSGLGRMFPTTNLPNLGPMSLPRHGMYAQEMTVGRSLGTLTGYGSKPVNMSAYEMQALAARDMGDRVSGFGTSAGIYGAGMAASAMAFSPLFAAGSAMGGAMGGGIGGFLGGWGLGLAGSMFAIPAAAGALASGVSAHAAQTSYIRDSSYRYALSGANIDPIMGSGFNRRTSSAIAKGLKGIEFGDTSLESGDIQGILDMGTQFDLFRGSTDSDSFLRKFKELTTSVKKVASAFHTSLAEATKIMGEFDQMGVTNPLDIGRILSKSDAMGMMSGRTAMEMGSVGFMGAEMARGTGISMMASAGMLQGNVASMTAMRASGAISNELVAQAGGTMALSQGITSAALNSVNNPYARVAMLGMSGPGGNLDTGMLNAIAGGATPTQMVNAAGANMRTPGQFISAYVNSEKIKNQVSESFGGQGLEVMMLGQSVGIAKQLRQLDPSINMEDAVRFTLRSSYDMTPQQADALLEKANRAEELGAEQVRGLNISARKQFEDVLWERGNIFARGTKAVGSALYSATVAPIATAAQSVGGSIERGLRSFAQSSLRLGLAFMNEGVVETRGIDEGDLTKVSKTFGTFGSGRNLKTFSSDDYLASDYDSFKKSVDMSQMLYEHRGAINNPAFYSAKSLDDASHQVFKKTYNELGAREKMLITYTSEGNSNVANDLSARSKGRQAGALKLSNRTASEISTELENTESTMLTLLNLEGRKGKANPNLPGLLDDAGSQLLHDAKSTERFSNLVEAKSATMKEGLSESDAMEANKKFVLAQQAFMGQTTIPKRYLEFGLKVASQTGAAGVNPNLAANVMGRRDLSIMSKQNEMFKNTSKFVANLSPSLTGKNAAKFATAQNIFQAKLGNEDEDIADIEMETLTSGLRLSGDQAVLGAIKKSEAGKTNREKFNILSSSLGLATTGAGGTQSINDQGPGGERTDAINENLSKSINDVTAATNAMKSLASQIVPLIKMLEKKGYIPNPT